MDLNLIIVDDDSVVLFLHKMLVERSSLPSPSGTFKNGREALDFISKDSIKKKPCLVFLDINMPVMNGWEFLDAIQETKFKENIYVVMITSSINSQDISTAKEYPQVIDYVEKPLRNELIQNIHDKLQDHLK